MPAGPWCDEGIPTMGAVHSHACAQLQIADPKLTV